ncbi:MAG: RluA family pseudouridine synthase [Bulleidia sp.]
MAKEITFRLTLADWNRKEGTVGSVLTHCLRLSRHEISRLKFDGEILLNGSPVHVTAPMRIGDVLTVRFPEDPRDSVKIVEEEPVILYEEEDFLAADKPAGMPVHPDHNHLEDSLGTLLKSHYQKRGENFTIRPIGRLDKDVSGIVLYAGNQPAAARMSRDRAEGKLKKYYLALAEGSFEQSDGTIDLPIGKEEGERRRQISEEGKTAITHYCVLKELHCQGRPYSLLRVWIETGRTHQIRAHMAAIGHPLLGDTLYGGRDDLIRRPALHCSEVILYSPFSREEVKIHSSLPEDMASLVMEDFSDDHKKSEVILSPVPEKVVVSAENPSDPKKAEKKKSPWRLNLFR